MLCQGKSVSEAVHKQVVWEGHSGEMTFSPREVRMQPFEGLRKIIPNRSRGPKARAGLCTEA